MAFRNPLGSVSALSLAANPTTLIAAAVIAGVAVTVGAAAWTYKAYKDYEEKKHREAIEQVNSLHNKFLARITVPDYNEIQGFPPIFKLIAGKDSHTAESMHLTDDEINDIGKNLPHGTDIALSIYRESVYNAILKLKEYYFSRKERNDITAGVISYLLYMLQTKCLNFEGYDYDIAYLKAISDFIIAYASLQNRENSQHFSRLNPVFSYITTARQALEKHKEVLSLEEMVGELRDSCIHQSNQLIRCMTKIMVKDKHWNLIKTVAIDELQQGLLRREYIKSEVKGLVLVKDDEKFLEESFFKNWLITLANYYIQTLDPDSKLSKKDVSSPAQSFWLPSAERLAILKQNASKLSKDEVREMHKLESDIKQIAKAFEKYPSFITTRLDPASKNKLPKMIPVTDPAEINVRATLIQNFASLIHQIISLQYLTTHLLKSTKQLGELYVKNPKHFCTIFYTLDTLCNQIKENINKNKKDITAVEKSDMNTMQLEAQEMLPAQIKELLDIAYASISRLGAKVKDYRNRVAKNLNPNEPTYQSVKLEMFEVAGLLSTIYRMDKNNIANADTIHPQGRQHHHHHREKGIEPGMELKPVVDPPATVATTVKPPETDNHPPVAPVPPQALPAIPVTTMTTPAAAPVSTPEPIHVPAPANTVIETHPDGTPSLNSVAGITTPATSVLDTAAGIKQATSVPDTVVGIHQERQTSVMPETTLPGRFVLMTALINQISSESADIIHQEFQQDPSHASVYHSISRALSSLTAKALAMLNEKQKTPQREVKVEKTLALITVLLEKTRDFMRLSANDRAEFAALYADAIKSEIEKPEHAAFIDDHYRPVSKAAYNLFHFSLFATDSRHRFNALSEACDQLALLHQKKERVTI